MTAVAPLIMPRLAAHKQPHLSVSGACPACSAGRVISVAGAGPKTQRKQKNAKILCWIAPGRSAAWIPFYASGRSLHHRRRASILHYPCSRDVDIYDPTDLGDWQSINAFPVPVLPARRAGSPCRRVMEVHTYDIFFFLRCRAESSTSGLFVIRI